MPNLSAEVRCQEHREDEKAEQLFEYLHRSQFLFSP